MRSWRRWKGGGCWRDLEGGTLVVTGTRRSDVINISMPVDAVNVAVTINGVNHGHHTGVQRIVVLAGRGNDTVTAPSPLPTRIVGARGNDSLTGGAGDDEIRGGLGADSITGAVGPMRWTASGATTS